MRLFRRSLVCLVVGVTAFGVAGWMLRPKPNWRTRLEAAQFASMINRYHSPDRGKPRWVYLHLNNSACAVVAIDPQTGTRLNEIRIDGDLWNRPTATSDGRLLVRKVIAANGGDGPGRVVDATEFRLFNARELDPVSVCRIVGDWQATDDGLHGWTATLKKEVLECTVVDIVSGQIRYQRRLEDFHRVEATGQSYCHVSPDGRLLAAYEWPRLKAERPTALLVMDLATGGLRRFAFPKHDPRAPFYFFWRPRFRDGERIFAEWMVSGFRSVDEAPEVTWWIDLSNGALSTRPRDRTSPSVPPPHDRELQAFHQSMDATLWTVGDLESGTAWFCLDERESMAVSWRPLPFPIRKDPRNVSSYEKINVQFDPASESLVVLNWDPPLAESLPQNLRAIIPTSSALSDPVRRCRWHDVRSGKWRDVGCPADTFSVDVCDGAVLAIVDPNRSSSAQFRAGATASPREPIELQSWPRPLRDPKWPAAGIASLCVATTWWFFARRAARKSIA